MLIPQLFPRLVRHLRLTAANYVRPATPPFLVLFVTSVCNQRCSHCFVWQRLNQPDDLTREEYLGLSRSLGRVEHLSLTGGEPFLAPHLAEVAWAFIRNNGTREIYIPTNAFFPNRVIEAVRGILRERALKSLVIEISLEGGAAYHDRFRGVPGSFANALRTYDALVAEQRADHRLHIHANSAVAAENLAEVRDLTNFLFQRCPQIEHHNLALVRGDRRDPGLQAPPIDEYLDLYRHVRCLWASRERGRHGGIVEPLLQWTKCQTVRQRRQVTPCAAGRLSAVVYANGDVSFCETHPPVGNLRAQTFSQIWESHAANSLRRQVAARRCYCTNETFLWPSIIYHPMSLVRTLLQTRWRL
jgi:MoaA/NifB/PqqE/SkfB family radical SAM enzyme